jgi:hypothetical protein
MAVLHVPETPVVSSSITHVGHDPATNTLSVRFKGGGLYHYANVSADEHAKFLAADSKGTHFRTFIRGQYPHMKVN